MCDTSAFRRHALREPCCLSICAQEAHACSCTVGIATSADQVSCHTLVKCHTCEGFVEGLLRFCRSSCGVLRSRTMHGEVATDGLGLAFHGL